MVSTVGLLVGAENNANGFLPDSLHYTWQTVASVIRNSPITRWIIVFDDKNNNVSEETSLLSDFFGGGGWHFRSLFVVEATFFNMMIAFLLGGCVK